MRVVEWNAQYGSAKEGEEEEEGVEWSGGKASFQCLPSEEEEQDRKRDYNPNAIPSNVGHDVAAIAHLKDAL
eukprot:2666775-Ditylum_brightwellii.AAC.1